MAQLGIAERLYAAFDQKDTKTMAALYSDEATFSDPVFPGLKGDEIGAMWEMLCRAGKDLTLTYELLEQDEQGARVRWVATYSFGPFKRKVVNVVNAELRFSGGQIVSHVDDFDLNAWMAMAFGLFGRWFGGVALFQRLFQRLARSGLVDFMKKRAAKQGNLC